jgi:predicted nuclease of restriction endonuclease-like (RecB) superfamily
MKSRLWETPVNRAGTPSERRVANTNNLLEMSETLNFNALLSAIEQTHRHFQQQAIKAVNVSLTVRNWLVGYYIVEFEQFGEERALYGEQLITRLAEHLSVKGLGETNLKNCRLFYKTYPELGGIVQSYCGYILPIQIRQSTTDEFESIDFKSVEKSQTASDELQPPPKLAKSVRYFQDLLERASFSHLAELIKIVDATKRTFYELVVLKTTPSVKELKRQMDTLAFERVGLSSNAGYATEDLMKKITPEQPAQAIKNVYTFEFLGLKTDGLVEEKDLESAILNHLQEFIRELGLGFCFEYRQQRILLDDVYYFIDLVFYHRILKCHVIIELKIDAFKHEHLGQLNTYVAYYNAEIKRPDDNPAIGILLCTEKGAKLVEYATAGMDNQLFVSKYLLALPSKETFENFIRRELAAWKC